MAETSGVDTNVNVNASATNTTSGSDGVEAKGKATETQVDTATSDSPTVESLMAEMAQLKADMARNKNALDKALKEKGEITKKLREKQTAEEAEAEAKAEAEAERKEREREMEKTIATYEAKSMFAEMGLSGTDLDTAVNAKIEGDEKTVYSIIVKHFENKYATALQTEKSEWLGNRPPVNVGVGESTTLTKEQFNNLSYKEKVELYNKDIETYNRLSQ